MPEERKVLHQRIVVNLVVTLAALLAVFFLGPKLFRFFLPIIIAWVIAMITNPLVSFLEKRIKIMRKHGSVIVIVLILAAVAALLVFGIREIILQVSAWVVDLPGLYQTVLQNINDSLATLHSKVHLIPSDMDKLLPGDNGRLNDYILKFLNSLTDSPMKTMSSLAGSVIDGLVLSILTIMLAYFFVADRQKIKDTILKYTPSSVKHIWNVFCDVMVKAVGGYLKACFKIMFIMFGILWCFFAALQDKD